MHRASARVRGDHKGQAMDAPLIASFLNRKGGVGKTSSVFHLAGSYAKSGRRVLVCDLDPQASLSQGYFGPRVVETADPE